MNVIIVGGGKVGTHLGRLLLKGGHRVRIVELNAEHIHKMQHDLPNEIIVTGSGTDADVLEAAGLRQADTVAAVAGNDEVNLVVAQLARFEYGVPRVIARVNNPKNDWMFTSQMGVDVKLDQADLIANLMLEKLVSR